MQAKPKILLVEDDHSIRLLMKRVLENCEIELITAKSGDEAIDACKKENMGLILMDIRMPGMDGLKTSAKIKEIQSGNNSVPIVAITAAKCDFDPHTYGIDECLEKPFEILKLYQTINERIGVVCRS